MCHSQIDRDPIPTPSAIRSGGHPNSGDPEADDPTVSYGGAMCVNSPIGKEHQDDTIDDPSCPGLDAVRKDGYTKAGSPPKELLSVSHTGAQRGASCDS